MIRPILGATKRVQRAKLYSNRLIDALSDNDDEDEDDEKMILKKRKMKS